MFFNVAIQTLKPRHLISFVDTANSVLYRVASLEAPK